MSTRLLLLVITFLVFSKQESYSQGGFSHEVGVIAGPLALFSDFGRRGDLKTNERNSTIGFGLIHYINFSYRADCNCYTAEKYWNDHFKIRSEIDYYSINLRHHGKWVAPDQQGDGAEYLRSMRGKSSVFDIGAQLEYFPMSIRDFAAGSYKLAPFISVGVHWVSFDSNITYDESLGIASNYYGGKYNPVTSMSNEGGNTWSIIGSIGVRYKLSPLSDLMLDSRWGHYFSNWVDGLNPEVPENKSNEWMYWLNFGYIYYLE